MRARTCVQSELQKLESSISSQDRERNRRVFYICACTYMSHDTCVSFRHVRTLKTQSKMDELALANLLEEKQLFLKKALKNYILCLRTGVRTIIMPV